MTSCHCWNVCFYSVLAQSFESTLCLLRNARTCASFPLTSGSGPIFRLLEHHLCTLLCHDEIWFFIGGPAGSPTPLFFFAFCACFWLSYLKSVGLCSLSRWGLLNHGPDIGEKDILAFLSAVGLAFVRSYLDDEALLTFDLLTLWPSLPCRTSQCWWRFLCPWSLCFSSSCEVLQEEGKSCPSLFRIPQSNIHSHSLTNR